MRAQRVREPLSKGRDFHNQCLLPRYVRSDDVRPCAACDAEAIAIGCVAGCTTMDSDWNVAARVFCEYKGIFAADAKWSDNAQGANEQ